MGRPGRWSARPAHRASGRRRRAPRVLSALPGSAGRPPPPRRAASAHARGPRRRRADRAARGGKPYPEDTPARKTRALDAVARKSVPGLAGVAGVELDHRARAVGEVQATLVVTNGDERR